MGPVEEQTEPKPDVEFDDYLIKLFWRFYRFKSIQWLILMIIGFKEKLDIHKFIKKPITKVTDNMDTCHFRTLYKQNHFQDNYTDPDFLCAMQVNTNLNYYTLGEAIRATIRVSNKFTSCIFYAIMYYNLSYDKLSPVSMTALSLAAVVVGYGVVHWINWAKNPLKYSRNVSSTLATIWSDCLVFLCCSGFSYLLVPILRTGTQSVATGTVFAVCTVLFGVHLLSNDYGLQFALVSKALSMNSAIFSTICMASRLQSDEHCLALMSFGVMSFICYPQWIDHIQGYFKRWTTAGSVAVLFAMTCAGYSISLLMALLLATAIFMIVVVCPILYVVYVQYKLNILGPWDEARPDLNVNMEEIEKGFEIRRSQRTHSSEESIGGGLEKSESAWNMTGGVNAEENIAHLEAQGIGLIL